MSRVFTPRRMAAIEDQVRRFCTRCLDPLVGSDGFDIIAELASMMPTRDIGMLLGILEADHVTALRGSRLLRHHRDNISHLTFGKGLHYCLDANLARLQGRVALDELLNRFPEWAVDYDRMELASTSTVRGWERLRRVLP
jgi:cytochrome P450